MEPATFVETLRREKASAILRTGDQNIARQAMEAVVAGGFRIVEFTLTIPGASELIREFAGRAGLIVGAGTVLTPEDAERAVAAGARFLVSPVVDLEVIRAAQDLGVAMMPGTHTPTEMLAAHRAGAQLQKVFPAPAGGASYLKACLGPMPFLKLVPTSGVDEANVGSWLQAGAWAVGFVASLFDPGDLEAERYGAITARARRIRAALESWSRAAR